MGRAGTGGLAFLCHQPLPGGNSNCIKHSFFGFKCELPPIITENLEILYRLWSPRMVGCCQSVAPILEVTYCLAYSTGCPDFPGFFFTASFFFSLIYNECGLEQRYLIW